MNVGTRYFCLFLALLLTCLTAGHLKTVCYAASIEYKQTMIRVLQETDFQGWPDGLGTTPRYPENIVVSANGSKVGFVARLNLYSDRRIYIMNGDGSGLVDLTGSLPPGVSSFRGLQINDDGSRLFVMDNICNIYYIDTSSPYACHDAYKPGSCWDGGPRGYSMNSEGTVIYLRHPWVVDTVSHDGLCSTNVGSNTLTPLVDLDSLTPAHTTDFSLGFLDAARTGGKLLFKYYPDSYHDSLTAMWESTSLTQTPNERHQSVWVMSLPFSHIFSADGSRALYYYSDYPNPWMFYFVDMATGEKTLIAKNAANMTFPAISPDGSIARWSSGGYNSTRANLATGDLRDTFSSRFPESSTVGGSNLTDITSDNRYYYVGSEPASISYIHRIDMAPVTTAPAPDVTSITFGRPQLIYGDTTPVTVTVQVSDQKGIDNIQSVQMKPLVNGLEYPQGEIYEPLVYQNPLPNSGGGVFTGTVYPQIWFSYNTTYPLPMQVGVRIVVRNKDEHYTIADTSIRVHPSSDVNPVQVLESLLKYASIYEAFAAVNSGGTIQAREFEFVEDLTIDRDFPVILKGGYDVAYSGNSGYSTIDGTVTVETGALTLERIILK